MFQRYHEGKSTQDAEIKSHQASEENREQSRTSKMRPLIEGDEARSEGERIVTDISQSLPHKSVVVQSPIIIEENKHSMKDKKYSHHHLATLPTSSMYSSAMELLSSVSASSRMFPEPHHSNSGSGVFLIPDGIQHVTKKIKNEESSTYSCQVCNHQFKNSTQLKNHFWKHTGNKPFKCDLCQACFTQQANLKTHLRIHTGERPFDCRYCGASFTQISNLKTHQKLHTGEKPFVCDLCNARFTQQSNLKSHRLIHTGERPFKCDVCEATFVQSTHLRNHKRIHTNERPFSCQQCGANFRQLSNLRSHEKTHSGEKPFICMECGSSFSQKSNLKAHKLKMHQIDDEEPPTRRGRKSSHGGSGPFTCTECGIAFSAAANLNNHMRLHTGEKPYECPVCFASFSQKSNLKAHELTHSNEKPFACPDCPSCFKQKANLRNHIMKKHSGVTMNYSPFLHNSAFTPISESPTLLNLGNPTPSSSSLLPKQPSQKILVIQDSGSNEPLIQIRDGKPVTSL